MKISTVQLTLSTVGCSDLSRRSLVDPSSSKEEGTPVVCWHAKIQKCQKNSVANGNRTSCNLFFT